VRDQDVYRVSHAIRQAGFTDVEIQQAMRMYLLMLDVACGSKSYREREMASQAVRDQKWYEWLGIPPADSYLWSWYPKIGNLDSLVFWKQVHVPVLMVYGELDRLVPVDESLTKIEASLDAARTPYTAITINGALRTVYRTDLSDWPKILSDKRISRSQSAGSLTSSDQPAMTFRSSLQVQRGFLLASWT
jgi:pimeloyl-ACP methyl ester carboxylesterase